MYLKMLEDEKLNLAIKRQLTTTDFNKERLLLVALLNPIAIDIVSKHFTNPVNNVSDIGLRLGYEIREIAVIRTTAEGICALLKELIDVNYNYLYNSFGSVKTVLGIDKFLPSSLQIEIVKYEEEMLTLNNRSKSALHSILAKNIELVPADGGN